MKTVLRALGTHLKIRTRWDAMRLGRRMGPLLEILGAEIGIGVGMEPLVSSPIAIPTPTSTIGADGVRSGHRNPGYLCGFSFSRNS